MPTSVASSALAAIGSGVSLPLGLFADVFDDVAAGLFFKVIEDVAAGLCFKVIEDGAAGLR